MSALERRLSLTHIPSLSPVHSPSSGRDENNTQQSQQSQQSQQLQPLKRDFSQHTPISLTLYYIYNLLLGHSVDTIPNPINQCEDFNTANSAIDGKNINLTDGIDSIGDINSSNVGDNINIDDIDDIDNIDDIDDIDNIDGINHPIQLPNTIKQTRSPIQLPSSPRHDETIAPLSLFTLHTSPSPNTHPHPTPLNIPPQDHNITHNNSNIDSNESYRLTFNQFIRSLRISEQRDHITLFFLRCGIPLDINQQARHVKDFFTSLCQYEIIEIGGEHETDNAYSNINLDQQHTPPTSLPSHSSSTGTQPLSKLESPTHKVLGSTQLKYWTPTSFTSYFSTLYTCSHDYIPVVPRYLSFFKSFQTTKPSSVNPIPIPPNYSKNNHVNIILGGCGVPIVPTSMCQNTMNSPITHCGITKPHTGTTPSPEDHTIQNQFQNNERIFSLQHLTNFVHEQFKMAQMSSQGDRIDPSNNGISFVYNDVIVSGTKQLLSQAVIDVDNDINEQVSKFRKTNSMERIDHNKKTQQLSIFDNSSKNFVVLYYQHKRYLLLVNMTRCDKYQTYSHRFISHNNMWSQNDITICHCLYRSNISCIRLSFSSTDGFGTNHYYSTPCLIHQQTTPIYCPKCHFVLDNIFTHVSQGVIERAQSNPVSDRNVLVPYDTIPASKPPTLTRSRLFHYGCILDATSQFIPHLSQESKLYTLLTNLGLLMDMEKEDNDGDVHNDQNVNNCLGGVNDISPFALTYHQRQIVSKYLSQPVLMNKFLARKGQEFPQTPNIRTIGSATPPSTPHVDSNVREVFQSEFIGADLLGKHHQPFDPPTTPNRNINNNNSNFVLKSPQMKQITSTIIHNDVIPSDDLFSLNSTNDCVGSSEDHKPTHHNQQISPAHTMNSQRFHPPQIPTSPSLMMEFITDLSPRDGETEHLNGHNPFSGIFHQESIHIYQSPSLPLQNQKDLSQFDHKYTIFHPNPIETQTPSANIQSQDGPNQHNTSNLHNPRSNHSMLAPKIIPNDPKIAFESKSTSQRFNIHFLHECQRFKHFFQNDLHSNSSMFNHVGHPTIAKSGNDIPTKSDTPLCSHVLASSNSIKAIINLSSYHSVYDMIDIITQSLLVSIHGAVLNHCINIDTIHNNKNCEESLMKSHPAKVNKNKILITPTYYLWCPIKDYSPPSLGQILFICLSFDQVVQLNQATPNVLKNANSVSPTALLTHCIAGQGRTGCINAVYIIYKYYQFFFKNYLTSIGQNQPLFPQINSAHNVGSNDSGDIGNGDHEYLRYREYLLHTISSLPITTPLERFSRSNASCVALPQHLISHEVINFIRETRPGSIETQTQESIVMEFEIEFRNLLFCPRKVTK